ncbi:hypothetical protein BBJ28_00023257, partial [Nothophytophthora sp. Chile5]
LPKRANWKGVWSRGTWKALMQTTRLDSIQATIAHDLKQHAHSVHHVPELLVSEGTPPTGTDQAEDDAFQAAGNASDGDAAEEEEEEEEEEDDEGDEADDLPPSPPKKPVAAKSYPPSKKKPAKRK